LRNNQKIVIIQTQTDKHVKNKVTIHDSEKGVVMAKFKVVLEREECIACESCIESCPASFEMANDGLAHLKGSTPAGTNDEWKTDDPGCSKDAAEICPVNIIHVIEGGKKII
jgi:ferredoxin